MNYLTVKKNLTEFNVKGEYSCNWFKIINDNNWENDTFDIFDFYKNDEKTYIDIGAWIGPTVLYCANKFKNVLCFEPDPVAINRLKENISANNFNNIILVEKAISDNCGEIEFGGNGELGNSESTILVGTSLKNDFLKNYNASLDEIERRKQDIIIVKTITLEQVLSENNIQSENIGLLKMDIEGGEIIVLPSIQDFLMKYKPNFFISLHPCFLSTEHINTILDILFNIYPNCFIFENNVKTTINRNIANQHNSLVFEN